MTTRPYFVQRIDCDAEGIKVIALVPSDGQPLPPITAGSHVDLHIERPDQLPLIRQYSLINAPGETDALIIGVKLELQSRGGSAWIHGCRIGDIVHVGAIRNNFALHNPSLHHVLVGAGIGITPIVSLMAELDARGCSYELHYFARDETHVALRDRLAIATARSRLTLHLALSPERTFTRLRDILGESRPAGSQLYYCGPSGFMHAVQELASSNWDDRCVHFERFSAGKPTLGDEDASFLVELKRSRVSCVVLPGVSIAEALRSCGHELPTSCEQGVCGACLTRVLDGIPDHRDAYLNKRERESNQLIIPCVSRARSQRLTLDA